MFSRATNASKTALLVFSQEFAQRGGQLMDCQVLNEHTASLGAVEISRRRYIEHLEQCRQETLPRDFWVPRMLFMPNA